MEKIITKIESTFLSDKGISLFLKRDDLLHPLISGNKFRKLKYTLEKVGRYKGIVSFGGAYSNHIYSLAAAGALYGVQTIGIIRGDEITELNSTLTFAKEKGMDLQFVSRSEYRLRYDSDYLAELAVKYKGWLIVPEGGTSKEGVLGCEEILPEISFDYDIVCTPVGSGGTISGLINSAPDKVSVLGFPALKNSEYLIDMIKELTLPNKMNWSFVKDYNFGGYAKMKPELLTFIKQFKHDFDILLDPIYTGKMMYGIFDLIDKDFFDSETTIMAIHTGGLQGWGGIDSKMLE